MTDSWFGKKLYNYRHISTHLIDPSAFSLVQRVSTERIRMGRGGFISWIQHLLRMDSTQNPMHNVVNQGRKK